MFNAVYILIDVLDAVDIFDADVLNAVNMEIIVVVSDTIMVLFQQ